MEEAWHTRLEKLLVDLVSDSLLQEVISKSEYPAILEGTFSGYVIDESCLFRYAKQPRCRETAEGADPGKDKDYAKNGVMT